MATYWHQHPRGFANECSLVRCESLEEAQDVEASGYERLTREQLRRHVSYVNSENDAWGSGNAFGRISLDAVLHSPDYAWGSDYGSI